MLASSGEDLIIQYYDECQVDYQIVWHLNSHLCMHYGYWDETTPNLRSALVRMNEQVAFLGEIKKGEYILDAGCGVGGSSIYLGKTFGCQVEGITLSQLQVDFATKRAMEAGLDCQVHFRVADYTKTHFPDESFDVVWAIESVCHAKNKYSFLKEAYRILKKGGRLIVADFFSNAAEERHNNSILLKKWADSWAVPEFASHSWFKEMTLENQFNLIHSIDITKHIQPSAKRLYYCFIPGIICDGVLRMFGNRTARHKANVWSTWYQYKSLKAGLWSYHIVKAVK